MSGNDSRQEAISNIINSVGPELAMPGALEDSWCADVFSLSKMKKVLPKAVFKSIEKTVVTGESLDPSIADVVATAMKDWAVSKGARYYAHVFYPLTGATAEKHDGFISRQGDGSAINEFGGKVLIQGEPDASSFPNGGIRSTFEARGYTAWDVTSPAYIMYTDNGATLCIPTVFVSWTGEALDKKTPILRSDVAVNTASQRILKLFGNDTDIPVLSDCGAEQEYFLVDAAFAAQRMDLLLTGRTLFGKAPAKGQEFDDHYFGAIPERVQNYMQDVEEQLYRLGIPAKTRHNEVAPGQFEIAPIFEASNVATDHQQLIMTTLKNTAKKHGFFCSMHEKPFAGINGSGKHVNWSVGNAKLGSIFNPGNTPHENAQFLVFCGAVLRGVHKFGGLLRAVVASSSNDHRLGANEAPPAIMSVYLGSQLKEIFDQIQAGKLEGTEDKGMMNIGVDTLPPLPKDAGDRNRTSPFAFTGNRFEFRAVGSNQSVSGPLVALNAMLADSLNFIADKLEGASDLNAAIQSVLKEIMDEHGQVIFNGDGYSAEWHKAAVEERGLKNLPTTADALPELLAPEVEELFGSTNVFSKVELESRFEIYSEQYVNSMAVEAKLMIDVVKTEIYPAALRHFGDVAASLSTLGELGIEMGRDDVSKGTEVVKGMMAAADKLAEAIEKEFDSVQDHLKFIASDVKSLMDEIRTAVDTLEGVVADDLWPLPSYEEMLFIK